jgi:hypothetical protein
MKGMEEQIAQVRSQRIPIAVIARARTRKRSLKTDEIEASSIAIA